MINFSGQTNKRVVNLGSSRNSRNNSRVGRIGGPSTTGNQSGNHSNNSNHSFLEQSRIQRIQREEQRNKERAANTLQQYVSRYLEMIDIREQILENWENNQPILTISWIYQFKFICKWTNCSPFEIERVLRLAKPVIYSSSIISEDIRNCGIPLESIQSVVSTVGLLIWKASRTPYTTIRNETIKIGALILLKVQDSRLKYHGIIKAIRDVIPQGKDPLNEDLHIILNELVFAINCKDSSFNFISYLASVEPTTGDHLPILRDLFNPTTVQQENELDKAILKLSKLEKIHLLKFFLNVHNNNGSNNIFELIDIKCIGKLLSHITFRVYLEDDDKVSHPGSNSDVSVDASTMESISLLYRHEFINELFDIIKEKDAHNMHTEVLQALCTLIFLSISHKNKFCMLITITSNSYPLIFSFIQSHPLYRLFLKKSDEGGDYLTYQELYQCQKNTSAQVSRIPFWKLIFTFEELYSYWLIVSNDVESFSNDKLTMEQIIEFIKFLKTLCLSLLFNPSNPGDLIENYTKLSDISITLLNQLYLKNLRLRFVQESFWKPNEILFNIDQMLMIIAEQEEKRVEMMMNDSDEDDQGQELEQSQSTYISPFASSSSMKENDDMSIDFVSNIDPNSSSSMMVKYEILKKLPFFVPFKDRVKVFQTLIELDRQRSLGIDHFSYGSRLKADIRRDFLLEDAFEQFHKIGAGFKNPLSVTFFNEWGQEAGIDGGGITKEFLTSVVTEGFRPGGKFGLFKETVSGNQLYPSDEICLRLSKNVIDNQAPGIADEQRLKLQYLRFLGTVIGKCFYENVLIDISFAPFFLTKWCNANRGNNSLKNSLNDLQYLDDELFQNLMKLTSMSETELKQLDLTFSIDEVIDDHTYSFDLMTNGSNIPVTTSNRLNYIHQVSNFKLNQSLHIQTKYFMEGLFDIISSNWLSMFDAYEIQSLISGGESDVNIQDWKENVEYGGYFDDDRTVLLFWEVVTEMTAEERFKLIKFVTSVSRAPLLGFGALNPKFGIRNSGRSEDRLPTASTCVNLLKLPDYQDKKIVREKLLYAINTDARFDLS
ncbi:E3 ubiquitin-protein ligase Hul5p [[Candida] anglica]|uniref:HECT-type E3 ubiquitin transferase n=1 Tax=[Candida] anglica TaxID=148631 RepID=A0ABP0ELQ9_9ASCO